MKSLFIIHYSDFAGAANEALRLARPLLRRGWSNRVLLPEGPGSALDRLRAGGVEVVQLPLHRIRRNLNPFVHLGYVRSFPDEVRQIESVIREHGIDLVVVAGLANPHGAIAARAAGVPLVWQILDVYTPRLLRLLLMPLVARSANMAMFAGRALIDVHGANRSHEFPFVVFYPPVDTQLFRPSASRRMETRTRLGIPANALVVGTLANIIPLKGIEYFIRAAEMTYQKNRDTWFVVVGASLNTHRRYEQRLHAELARSSLPLGRFIFTGRTANPESLYPAMDVKVITSLSEATPTTAIEAMACGVSVVATDVGGVREIVVDGVTGLIVPPHRSEAIAKAVVYLLDRPDLRQEFGQASRTRAVDRFDVEISADTHVRAFEAALANYVHRAKPPASRSGDQS